MPEAPNSDAALEQRLKDLQKDLKQADMTAKSLVARERAHALSGSSSSAGMGIGMRVLSECVGGILVGSFIGWQLDQWLGMTPWGFIMFAALGTFAGFWNIYRLAMPPKMPQDLTERSKNA